MKTKKPHKELDFFKGHEGHSADEGYDRSEPDAGAILLWGGAILVTLAVVLVGVTWYFNQINEMETAVKQLEPMSEQFGATRQREDMALLRYSYIDKDKGSVRLPVERAMELYASEAASGKLHYPGQPARVKTAEELAAAAAGGAAAEAKPEAK
ncbi:MAG: hypothetical protein FJW40_15880 [Acidobacteria bacterium]|nr:hypothetical protein [Acidobacteriota bacterium]